MTNDTTQLVESMIRMGKKADLSQWRVIDLEQDALRRLGSELQSLASTGVRDKNRKSYRAKAMRLVHGDGVYKLCFFLADQFQKRLLQMRRTGSVVLHTDIRDPNESACGQQHRSDTVSGTTLRGMIEMFSPGEAIPLCPECCSAVWGAHLAGRAGEWPR